MDEQFLMDDIYPSNGPPPTLAEYAPMALIPRADLDFDEYQDLWSTLIGMQHSHLFWIGDAQIFGDRFGEDASQVLDAYAAETNRVARWVCAVMPAAERRTSLTFTHHKLVVKLDKPDRDRLLDEAVAEKLSTRDLEQRVKAIKTPTPTPAAKAEGDDPGDEHRDSPNTAGPARQATSDTQRAIRAPFERLREDFMARCGPDGGRMHDHEDALVWEAVLAAVDYVLVGRASAETGLRFALEQLRLQAVEG